jgi:hypothetical protein
MSSLVGRLSNRSLVMSGFLGGWTVMALVGTLIASGASHSPPLALGGLGPVNWARPLINGQVTTISGAASEAGYSIPIPTATAASQSNLTRVWESPNKDVALVFDGGKVTVLIRPAVYTDPASWFNTIVAESPGKAAIGQVNGKPAVVIQPNSDPYGANPAWIEFYRNGLDVNVISASYGTGTLLSIADSIQ